MKDRVYPFTDLRGVLKGLETVIHNPALLTIGRKIGGLLPREILVNWLICAALNFHYGHDRYTFAAPGRSQQGDGIIFDRDADEGVATEHVMVPPIRSGEGAGGLILEKIGKKAARYSPDHAAVLTLVVFLEGGFGVWHPTAVARTLPRPLGFKDVWVVGLQGRNDEDGSYLYAVALLEAWDGGAPVWLVRILGDFESWSVQRYQ